jgi:hypothetical protein
LQHNAVIAENPSLNLTFPAAIKQLVKRVERTTTIKQHLNDLIIE